MTADLTLLLGLYEATAFRLECPTDHHHIRIGNLHPGIDQLLADLGATEWAYITAWNPKSQPVSSAQNAAAQDKLKMLLRERGLLFYEGDGIPDTGDWTPERSVRVAGISRREAIGIGTQFGQTAIVVGTRGGVAELVYCVDAGESEI